MPADPAVKSSTTVRQSQRRPARRDSGDVYADNSTYAREIELKRSRGEISCAECRRLKIRCDKSIPCQSCQRRGCAALCPNGSLATGQGTRFVLAATEHLHRRIAKMSERIRDLEDALAIVQAKCSEEPHPLLGSGRIISNAGSEGPPITDQSSSGSQSVTDTFGMLSISDQGVSTFFGPTGGTEYLLINEVDSSHPSPRSDLDLTDSVRSSESPPILEGPGSRFSSAFPFTPIGQPSEVYDMILEQHLPRRDRAYELANLYLERCGWIFRAVPQQQVIDEMLPYFYGSGASGSSTSPVDYGAAHDLALMLLIFAVGSLVDFTLVLNNADAEHYHQLAVAAMGLQSVWDKPSLTTVQALHLYSIYYAMTGTESGPGGSGMEMSWGLLSLATQISQTIGLHRDSSKWNLPPDLVNRRRLIFWNIFEADSWQSLTTGRPPSFSRVYIDCQLPRSQNAPDEEPDESDFQSWFARFSYHCVAEVAIRTLSAIPPQYETILDLDRQIRDFPVPPEATAIVEGLSPPPDSDPIPMTASMQYFVISHSREILLLYIHRSFFAQTLIDCPTNPARSTYAQSFLSIYRAAHRVLKSIREQFALYPEVCSRIWPVWTYGFFATVVFGMIAIRSSRSPIASEAMTELNIAAELFGQAARYSRRADRALTSILKLRDKAEAALAAVHGHPSTPLSHDASQWDVKFESPEDDQDDLEIFAGKTRGPTILPSSQSPSRQAQSSPHSRSVHISPPIPSSTSHPQPFAPPQPRRSTPSYPVPGTSTHSSWVSQQAPVHAYHPHASDPWFRQVDYTQPQAHEHGWSGPQRPGHVVMTPDPSAHLQHSGVGPVPPYSAHPPPPPPVTQEFRQHEQMYSPAAAAFQGAHQAPFVVTPALAEMGLSRDSALEPRWTSLMHEAGFLDETSYGN
ncbi:uncharacterized protein LAESUDRAFT_687970 [Laetiporus sulphureus 93-53]|uniref:Zn(2)-C6 fungal-type domain-containing protein n=1 Tax=Laetiporus sulphureus 93-53 TaxID=1314785 RepID=A0A165B9S6_9APHY|nr:uncharacterized protein LAESUDRAFT_687970 [Laetiporus sulphureus 93-53]KZT00576.1 hypothetical protein LAESUDRAFT_687970 [Laetiporus sulphureus 93-53]